MLESVICMFSKKLTLYGEGEIGLQDTHYVANLITGMEKSRQLGIYRLGGPWV